MKILTNDNLLVADELSAGLIDPDGEVETGGGTLPEHFVERILAAQLSEDVPEQLHAFFAAARGAMIYGYFYYPLFSLATQNLLHLCEAAITLKYTQANGPRRVVAGRRGNTITDKIWWLKAHGFMKVPQAEYFQEVWETRNWVFHRTHQRSFPPPLAMVALDASAEQINALFANSEESETKSVKPAIRKVK